MKSQNVIFLLLLLRMCFLFGQKTKYQKCIVIDVGHGRKDSGAIGINGIKEKDIVLDIALKILSLNKKSESPLEIYLTRYNNTLISLSDRTKLAKALNANLFISLHCNHSENPNARGIEIYVANTKSKYLDNSTWLAFQLQEAFEKKLGFESRGVKFANFQVLRETKNSFTSMLLELGFLSNWDEYNYYLNPANFQVLAMLVLECLIEKFSGYERVSD